MSTPPQNPDLARDLIRLAGQASTHWSRRIRDTLDARTLGQFRHADHVNAGVLRRVLAEHDWPGHRLVGVDGCRAAWQIALHADHDYALQSAAVRLLRQAVDQRDAPVWQWAHLQDRALIAKGQPQEWGTQYQLTPAGVRPCPVREPATLDTRRAALGLPRAEAAMAALLDRLAAPRHDAAASGELEVPSPLAGAA
ncbi:DUF6624 domain-containing protein [Streptomyces misionensis]|uniref:DUF6624 domain-containing protein n=1 Tax=Streptomyces misionensis TaxID=67331 RepID=UPI003437F95A